MENSNERKIIERDTKKSDKDGFFKQKFEKIDKYVFDVNILNKIIAVFAVIFVVCFFVFSAKLQNKIIQDNDAYQKMLAELEARQLIDIYNNTTDDKGSGSTITNLETPMFNNGIEAVCFAFNKFYNYSCFEIEGKGTTYSSAAGQNVEILINSYSAKYSDGIVYNQNIRKETKSNFGQTEATETIYTGTEKWTRNGTNIRKSGDKYIADFSGNFQKRNSEIVRYAFYEVNKQTALYTKSFSFVRNDDGSIAYYKATILLDAQKATTKYAKEIQEQGGTSYPNVSYLEIACIIDRNGDMKSYNVKETMTLTKTVVINITATANNEFTYIFLSQNKTPSVARPNYN